ncbi:hypothetical protein F5B19DRAFT_338845 [Rostrohypoxylon terebratum]|nr:hypothetical protein F5B19DRAFT_338845 [Rostrohypoxylon terebratum]
MEEAEDATAAMAEAMGFSSFGAQNANKRRKFNPRADEAVVASTSAIPLHQTGVIKEAKSGSNATPLGVRARNEDEIDLGEDGDQSGAPQSEAHRGLNNDSSDQPGPQYMDTSRPPTAIVTDSTDDVQSKIDIITGAPSHQWEAQSSSFSNDSGASYRDGYSRGHRGNRGRGQGRGRGRGRGGGGQGHEPGHKWWEGYYDPSTNTNPWESLEKAGNLEPVGNWMTWEEAKSRSGRASAS